MKYFINSPNCGQLNPDSYGRKAFESFIGCLKPLDGSYELWLKAGKYAFFRGDFNRSGNFPIVLTEKKNDKRSDLKTYTDCYSYLRQWSETNDDGIFYLPSQPQGLPKKEAANYSDDIAAEIDDGTRESQAAAITEFIEITGLEPRFIIHSGGKSYHIHWGADLHLPIAQNVYLRRLLCIALNSDPAVTLPSQPMRIPGFARRKKGKQSEQTLEFSSIHRFSYEQILQGFHKYFTAKSIPFPADISDDRWRLYKGNREQADRGYSWLTKPEANFYPKRRRESIPVVSSNTAVPLIALVSKRHKDLIENGVGSDRNNTGVAIARDLIGCESEAANLGVSVVDTAEDLFYLYCRNCPPGGGWNEREWGQLWRGQRNDSYTPARKDLSGAIHRYRYDHDDAYKREYLKEKYKYSRQFKEKTEPFVGFLLKHVSPQFRKRLLENTKEIRYGVDEIPVLGTDEPVKIIFPAGKRNETIMAVRDRGWRNVLDTSIPGLGKSHDMGEMSNDFGKTWIANKEHRNPTTATIEDNFVDLQTRNDGLDYDHSRKTPLGRSYQRTTKDPANADIDSLCKNARLFHHFTALNYRAEEEEKTNPICANCEHFTQKRKDKNGNVMPKCAVSRGKGWGYMWVRGMGLLESKISCSINSLPAPDSHNYQSDILAIDEADTEVAGIAQQLLSIKHMDKSIMRVLKLFPMVGTKLQAIFNQIQPYLDGREQQPYHGFEQSKILELLGELPHDIEEIIAACAVATPKIKDFFTSKDSLEAKSFDRQVRRLAAAANEEFRKEAEAETKRKIRELEPNWLVDFLQIWAGLIPGSLRISGSKLILTTRSDRHGAVVRASGLTLLSDATANPDAICAKLGIHRNSLIQIEQEQPDFSNLTVINIETVGLGSNRPSKPSTERARHLTNTIIAKHGMMPVIAHKLMLTGYYWFNDTRGVNHFEGEPNLILIGTPRKNVGAARDEYYSLYGTYEEFTEYYNNLIRAEQLQAIFRQRSHRYPERQFKIFYIGKDLDLQFLEDMGIKVIYRDATELSPEAGSKGQVTKFLIGQMLKYVIKTGDRSFTQKSMAEQMGRCQQTLSAYLKTLGSGWIQFKNEILDFLLKPLNRETSKMLEHKINAWVAEDLEAETEEVVKTFVHHGWSDFQQYLGLFCLDQQAKFLGLLLNLVLTDEERAEIFGDFHPPPT